MSFNPLQEKGIPLDQQFRNWSELNVQPHSTAYATIVFNETL
jgi:hypothetical protein